MPFEELKKYQNSLKKIITSAKHDIETAPEGTLKITRKNGHIVYLHRTKADSSNGKYIPKTNHHLAKCLAQKSYAQKVLKNAISTEKKITECLSYLKNHEVSDVYCKMNRYRKELINPYEISNEEYAKQWEKTEYEQFLKLNSENKSLYKTDKGELVRSKSEVIIANRLFASHIPYRYEFPIQINEKTFHPDFYVLNTRTRQEFILEHFGLMDDSKYRNNAFCKIESYIENGYYPGLNLLYTFESSEHPINLPCLIELIEKYFS